MSITFKTEEEYKRFMKPHRQRRLKEQLGDDGFKLLEKALRDNERLHKQMRSMETRIDNLTKRIITLELMEDNNDESKTCSGDH